MSTAASPRPTPPPGRIGHPVGQQRADRLEQEVAVGAQAAAQHDERGVGDGGQRDDVQRDRRASSSTTARATRRRGGRPRTRRGRRRARRSAVTAPGAPGQPGAPGPTTAAAHGSMSGRRRPPRSRARRRRRGARGSSSPWSTSPAPRPVPIERKAKSSTPRPRPRHCSPSAARLMSFSTARGPEARLELRAERAALHAGDVVGQLHAAGLRLDDAREPITAQSMTARPAGRRRRPGVSRSPATASSDVAASAPARRRGARGRRRARSERAAQEARADVDAEDERGLVDRLEEDRSVAGPGRVVRRLADEPGVQQRLQRERDGRLRDPTRREISAREIGAPARIASRTVRSLRSFSSGAVARRGPGARRISSGSLTQIRDRHDFPKSGLDAPRPQSKYGRFRKVV